MTKFEIFRGTNNQYYFRFKASNGEQILSSEGYITKQGCLNGIESVKAHAPFDNTYQKIDKPYDYRFNMVARNGEVIARSSEGYTTQHNRDHAISVVKFQAPSAQVIDLT
jgi:uncharacterized protein